MRVTVSHQQMQRWTGEDATTKLSQRGPESFWMHKMMNLVLLQTAPEAVNGSIFGLIHLAVRPQRTILCPKCIAL